MVNERESDAERRRGRRTGLRRPCMLQLSGADQRAGITVDLGVDGLSLYTARPVAAGTRCEICFELSGGPAAPSLRIAAKVVYSSYSGQQGFKIGAIFVALDAPTTAALLAFASG